MLTENTISPLLLDLDAGKGCNYLDISADATPVDNISPKELRKQGIIHKGWVKKDFFNSGMPEILFKLDNGFVNRLVKWLNPSDSPVFDLSFLSNSILVDDISSVSPNNKLSFLDGPCRKWHENGQLAVESNHASGYFHGALKVWAQDGQLIEKSYCKYGKYDKERFIIEQNQSVLLKSSECWASYSYENGTLNGSFYKWHANGRIWISGEHKNGELNGLFSEYNNEGFRVFKTMYKEGREIWSKIAFGN